MPKSAASAAADSRLPPGQTLVTNFPVLSYGPTPRFDPATWNLRVSGLVERPLVFTWNQFRELPRTTQLADFHCVTSWSRFDNRWEGVKTRLVAELAGVKADARHVFVRCDGGYTTNLPLEEMTRGQAWIVDTYEGQPLEPEHGAPARLLVPHLYFWKSAKWVRGLRLIEHDEPGFWESLGYNNHGDPWKEERYWSD